MKKVSILIPCYNEEENVRPMSEAIVNLFENELIQYDYELLFIDNDSSDQTRVILRDICKKISISRLFLMLKILDNLIRLIMECYRQRVIAQLVWFVIFKIQLK